MKNLTILSILVLFLSCSTSSEDTPSDSCTSKCKFSKDLSVNQFFYINGVAVDCKTNIPTSETLKKIQSTQTQTVFFCGCD